MPSSITLNSLANFKESFYSEPSLLNAAAVVQHKRERKLYNFSTLPSTAVLIHTNMLSRQQTVFKSRLKGLAGKNYLINSDCILCTEFGNGAPAIITLMEELRVLGVTEFVFAGFAGSLLSGVKEGEMFFVKEAFSTTGCSAFYHAQEKIAAPFSNAHNSLIKELFLMEAVCWSTDAPYRETKSLVESFRQKGCTHVDMECAAIYAFCSFYNLSAMCILITADSFDSDKWKMPSDTGHLKKVLKSAVSQILSGNYER